jgi:hypothetical protein
MEHSEFRIGTEFYKDGYPTPDQAPPYSDAVEHVFDEYDLPGTYRQPQDD